MKITKAEKVYTVEGTSKEVREFARSLYEEYREVAIYPTTYDYKVVCSN